MEMNILYKIDDAHEKIKLIRDIILTKILNKYYNAKFDLSLKKIKPLDQNNGLIVSLTSFPARMDYIDLCLKSLLYQTYRPDKIILYLGVDEFKNIELPEKVRSLFKYGVEVRYRKDLKPHTKYFYAMQEFPECDIITVDDDILYRPNLIKDLYVNHLKYPGMVICTRAHKIKCKGNEFLPYVDWEYETKDILQPRHSLLATGVGGVLYPKGILKKEVFNIENIQKCALQQDDLWLKIMEIISNVKVKCIAHRRTKYLVGINNAEKVNLNTANVYGGKNDICWSSLIKLYNLTVSDFFD